MATLNNTKVVISKILYGFDNDSFMLGNSNHNEICNVCKTHTEKKINFDFKLKKKSYDFSYTYDGYVIVSTRFRQFCNDRNMEGLNFISLKNHPDFFVMTSDNIVELDHERRKTSMEDFCPCCNRYLSISGASPNFFKSKDTELKGTIYRSDMVYGYKNEQSYILIINMDLYFEIIKEKFEGLSFSDIYK